MGKEKSVLGGGVGKKKPTKRHQAESEEARRTGREGEAPEGNGMRDQGKKR